MTSSSRRRVLSAALPSQEAANGAQTSAALRSSVRLRVRLCEPWPPAAVRSWPYPSLAQSHPGGEKFKVDVIQLAPSALP
jgi:hypothetical protein